MIAVIKPERLTELVNIACHYFKPTAFSYDYNDRCYDWISGYSMSSETISVSLAEFRHVPSSEKMIGIFELRKKFLAIGVSVDTIVRLTTLYFF